MRADLEATIAYHLDRGLPGDAATVVLLYLMLNRLVLDQLTLPEVLEGVAGLDMDSLAALVVERTLPRPAQGSPHAPTGQ